MTTLKERRKIAHDIVYKKMLKGILSHKPKKGTFSKPTVLGIIEEVKKEINKCERNLMDLM